jgi:hypothetical protein
LSKKSNPKNRHPYEHQMKSPLKSKNLSHNLEFASGGPTPESVLLEAPAPIPLPTQKKIKT